MATHPRSFPLGRRTTGSAGLFATEPAKNLRPISPKFSINAFKLVWSHCYARRSQPATRHLSLPSCLLLSHLPTSGSWSFISWSPRLPVSQTRLSFGLFSSWPFHLSPSATRHALGLSTFSDSTFALFYSYLLSVGHRGDPSPLRSGSWSLGLLVF